METTLEAYTSLDKTNGTVPDTALALHQVLMENNLQNTFTKLEVLKHSHHHTKDNMEIGEVIFYIKQDRKRFLETQFTGYVLHWRHGTFLISTPWVIEKFATQKDRQAKFFYK